MSIFTDSELVHMLALEDKSQSEILFGSLTSVENVGRAETIGERQQTLEQGVILGFS